VLIQVAAAGIDDTDVDTRIGWYSRGRGRGGDLTGRNPTDRGEAAAPRRP
jgi:hypothetical protein